MTMLGLVSLLAAAVQPAPPSVRENCFSLETPQGIVIVDRILLVFFESGSARIQGPAPALLDGYAERYDALPHCYLYIAGHADTAGTSAANLELSRRRADAVAAYLRSRGVVAPARVEAFGEARPLIETPDGVAEPQNRRVEIYVDEPPR
jgi:outer membrane protein OmpA-like peptidoglycan-associated protein